MSARSRLALRFSSSRLLLPFLILVLFILKPHPQPALAQSARSLRFPVDAPPGPSSWLLGQPYGNTVGAYLRGSDWYEAGQRLHFGIDISMPCGTPLVAVGDGTVMFVDDLGFGSGPHNLLIRHDDVTTPDGVGIISLYGHLLERPALVPGQTVAAGQVVAQSGDPDETCDSRPHLHLELRSLDYFTAYNPVAYIEANWDALSAVGSFSSTPFMQDLDNARRWMTFLDQPTVRFGGRALNDYAAPYPDIRTGAPPANPPLLRSTQPIPDGTSWAATPLTFDGCCASAWWDATAPARLYTIDGADGTRAAIFAWNTENVGDGQLDLIGEAPPPRTSADGTHQIALEGDEMIIRRSADGAAWRVNTGGQWAGLNADNSRLLWTFTPQVQTALDSEPITTIYSSLADGSDARVVAEFPSASANWLDSTRILVASRERIRTTLHIVDTATNSAYTLGAYDWLRGLTIAPGGGRLMFYLANQPEPQANGVYMLTTTPDENGQFVSARPPWFGSWRWRDGDSVFYLPLDTSQPYHTFHLYDLNTFADQVVFDGSTIPLQVANSLWGVSADGSQIMAWNARDLRIYIIGNG